MPSAEEDEARSYDYELRMAEDHWDREFGGDEQDDGYDPSDGEGWSDEW